MALHQRILSCWVQKKGHTPRPFAPSALTLAGGCPSPLKAGADLSGLFRRMKIKREPVHAIAFARRGRPIGEDVAQMPLAGSTMNFRADHAMPRIPRGFHRAFNRCKKGRPATTAFIFGVRYKKRLTAPGAMIHARPFFIIQRAGTGAFRAMLTQNTLLIWRQGLAGAAAHWRAAFRLAWSDLI